MASFLRRTLGADVFSSFQRDENRKFWRLSRPLGCQRVRVDVRRQVVTGRVGEVGDGNLKCSVWAEDESLVSLAAVSFFKEIADQVSLAEQVGGGVQALALGVRHDDQLPKLPRAARTPGLISRSSSRFTGPVNTHALKPWVRALSRM